MGPETGQSKTREVEAKVIVRELVAALAADPHLTFGVIAFYSGQVRAVWEELERIGYAVREGERLHPGALGQSPLDGRWPGTSAGGDGRRLPGPRVRRGVPLHDPIATPRPAPRPPLRLLALPNRLCVAMSRQRKLLVVVGDSAMFTHDDAKDEGARAGRVPRALQGGRWPPSTSVSSRFISPPNSTGAPSSRFSRRPSGGGPWSTGSPAGAVTCCSPPSLD